MQRHSITVLAILFSLGIVFCAGHAVAANDEESVQPSVWAPLEMVDCTGVPPTINVLGITIDISHAELFSDSYGEEGSLTCTDLVVAQTVQVTLGSSTPDTETLLLHATQLYMVPESYEEEEGGGEEGYEEGTDDTTCDEVSVTSIDGGPDLVLVGPTLPPPKSSTAKTGTWGVNAGEADGKKLDVSIGFFGNVAGVTETGEPLDENIPKNEGNSE